MINLNYNGIKNSLLSYSMFSFTYNRRVNNIILENKIEEDHKKIEENKVFKDYKTTLGRNDIDIIDKINDNIIVYLFIQKNKTFSSWNLVVPVIKEKTTEKLYQFRLGDFALEGQGGGLRNTELFINSIKKHNNKGFKVPLLPKVIDNKLLTNFELLIAE